MASCPSTIYYMAPHFPTDLWNCHCHEEIFHTCVIQFLGSASCSIDLFVYPYATPHSFDDFVCIWSLGYGRYDRDWLAFHPTCSLLFLGLQMASISQPPWQQVWPHEWVLASDVNGNNVHHCLQKLRCIIPHSLSFSTSLMQICMVTLKGGNQKWNKPGSTTCCL